MYLSEYRLITRRTAGIRSVRGAGGDATQIPVPCRPSGHCHRLAGLSLPACYSTQSWRQPTTGRSSSPRSDGPFSASRSGLPYGPSARQLDPSCSVRCLMPRLGPSRKADPVCFLPTGFDYSMLGTITAMDAFEQVMGKCKTPRLHGPNLC
jgi:hypothetical protein